MDLVIASHNDDKVREIRAVVSDFFDRVRTLKDLGVEIEIEETGETFSDNALIKGRAVAERTGLLALADDSGLCVRALNNAPGVFSARYAGNRASSAANNALLLKNMSGKEDRRAFFVCCLALCRPDGGYIVAEGKTEGEILRAPDGTFGFGYDPLFYSYDLKKTFASASEEEKNSVSHRGRALRALARKLSEGFIDKDAKM